MTDIDSIYPKVERVFVFMKDMNDDLVNSFNSETFRNVVLFLQWKISIGKI